MVDREEPLPQYEEGSECFPNTWSGIFFRAGVAYGRHKNEGGKLTDRAFLIKYLAENFHPPKPLKVGDQ